MPKHATGFTACLDRRCALGKLHPPRRKSPTMTSSAPSEDWLRCRGRSQRSDEYHCFDALAALQTIPPADHPARGFHKAIADLWLEHDRTSACSHAHQLARSRDGKGSRPCASSCRAASSVATTPTPRTIRPSTRSKASAWTERHRRRPQGHGGICLPRVMGDDVKIRFRPHYFSPHRPTTS